MPPAPPPMLRFGPFEVDLRSGELRKNGTRLRLQEKPLRVLMLLAGRQGELVTRDELKEDLWPEDTFVDFEAGLNTAVKKLRAAIADDAENPRYIETFPRRGYRFLAPVEFTGNIEAQASELAVAPLSTPVDSPGPELSASPIAPSPAPASSIPPPVPGRNRITIGPWAVGGFAALLILGVLWWLTPLPEPRMENIFPVTTTGKLDFLVRPATDGVRVFYVQRAGGHYDLMQSSVNGGEPQKVNAPFPNSLIWDVSPDGSQYLLTSFVHRGEPSPLWKWPATGGPPIKVDDLISGSASWSPNGKSIVYHNGHDLLVAAVDGSAKRTLHTFREEPDSPVWSHDGLQIRFTLNDPERDTHTIWEIGADGAGLRQILPAWSTSRQICCGTWSADGRYFIFVEIADRPRLWALREHGTWWRRSPRGPFLLASEATGSWSPLAGRDGVHLYYYGHGQSVALERMDAGSRQLTAFLPDSQANMPAISRDGLWITYVQLPTGQLWRSRLDGNEAMPLATGDLRVGLPRWSPDGRTIAFSGQRAGEAAKIYLISRNGGHAQPQFPAEGGLNDPDWSPDGSTIVATREANPSTPGVRESAVVLLHLDSQTIENVPGSADRYGPRWSPDGRWIAAMNGGTHNLEVYEVKTSTWKIVATGNSLGLPVWSADGAYLYYQDLLADDEPLFRYKLSSGTVERVTDFREALSSGLQRCAFLDLTPSGEPIVSLQRSAADIYGATLSLP